MPISLSPHRACEAGDAAGVADSLDKVTFAQIANDPENLGHGHPELEGPNGLDIYLRRDLLYRQGLSREHLLNGLDAAQFRLADRAGPTATAGERPTVTRQHQRRVQRLDPRQAVQVLAQRVVVNPVMEVDRRGDFPVADDRRR